MEKLLLFDKFFAIEGLEILLFIRDILLTILTGVKHGIHQSLQTNSSIHLKFFPLVFPSSALQNRY
jgi:hypothetical protein